MLLAGASRVIFGWWACASPVAERRFCAVGVDMACPNAMVRFVNWCGPKRLRGDAEYRGHGGPQRRSPQQAHSNSRAPARASALGVCGRVKDRSLVGQSENQRRVRRPNNRPRSIAWR